MIEITLFGFVFKGNFLCLVLLNQFIPLILFFMPLRFIPLIVIALHFIPLHFIALHVACIVRGRYNKPSARNRAIWPLFCGGLYIPAPEKITISSSQHLLLLTRSKQVFLSRWHRVEHTFYKLPQLTCLPGLDMGQVRDPHYVSC